MPARWPFHSFMRMKISLLSTSSGFCTSPCTLTAPACGTAAAPSESPSSPKATMRAIALQASETSRISALRSPLAAGKRRRSSIR